MVPPLARRALLGAALAAPALRGAAAQSFPDKPIRLLVPFPPGGPVDLSARIVAQALSEELKTSVVVENRSGAGGVVGTDAVAKAQPDGYTLGFSSTGAVAVNVTLLPNNPYDSRKDFAPVSIVAGVPTLLCVNPKLPARSVAELVALAKAQPGRLNFGSSGPGGTPHLSGERFKLATGANIAHVPYRGAAPAITALLADEVEVAFLDLPVLLPHVQEGRLRALAVTSPQRSPALPEVPTFAEAGVQGMEIENWYALLAPAGTPPDRVARLHAATAAAMARPATANQFISQGARIIVSRPDEALSFIREEVGRWGEVVRAAGVKAD
ncbi:Bug family tripartite tricarboxylate transporter substrate binding protein [Roseomonas populi]|uniref:Tripartite tricarboxylate transporter substrate binding protein n=1 Tax=Roseomonas populi TaxID=3121582 RepID=A0ABT1X375_9PROT|nr:tripartite tricarboxylate transporter substrate binding protein [Roseomonas pecuniae]MCR0982555.1 tripartite tricarboxylate transporter substrate binding protein [Roseomonas pecuniae]